jgi:hypothetical protein
VIFPLVTAITDRPQAVRQVIVRGREALSIAQAMPPDQLTQRQLIPRFTGIEDSYRYWSVLMCVQHLWITGEAMAQTIEHLANGQPGPQEVRIEAVKPDPEEPAEAVFQRYEEFLARYADRMTPLLSRDLTRHRHDHPWFGPISAHQWLCLNGMHHGIHLTQIHKIRAAL